MGLLKIFSGKAPEECEQRGDEQFEAKAYGKAKVQYEHALSKLEKTSPWDDGYRQILQEKIRRSKEALALEHKQTAESMMEAGYDDDARQYIQLAQELTQDQGLKSDLEKHLQDLEARAAKEIQMDIADVESADEEDEPDEQPDYEETDEEQFMALIGTMPDEIQKAYLSYGEAFKHGYLALNRGDFELAAHNLSRAMEAHADPQSYIPLELATAHLNLGAYEDARRLIESFLQYHPDELPGYRLLCEIYWETKAFDRAEALLSSLPQELAESVAGYLLRGETLYRAEKYSEAKSFYRGFQKTYGWHEPIARALAKTHEALGEMANARNIYREIMDQCRTCRARIDPYVKQKYADLSFASGLNTTEILELYLSLAQEVSQNAPDYYQKISRIYESQGNEEQARRFQLIAEKTKSNDG